MKSSTLAVLVGGVFVLGTAGCAGEVTDEGGELGSVQSALTTVHQAENAFDIDEGVVESIHAGFTGTGYVNINNFSNTFMWHIVNAPVAGSASLRVRYANGTGSNRPIAVSSGSGGGGTVTGAPTGSWSTWVLSAPVTITLAAGNNDVFHSSVVADGMPNIDRFEITQTFSQIFQAEAANDINEGVVESIHAGFTGTGYVNINNFSNTFMLHVVNSPVTSTATLRVRYANGTGSNRPIALTVNGVNAGTINGAPTGSWTTWVTSAAVPVSLTSGNNDIVHSSVVADGMPNIDRFDITW